MSETLNRQVYYMDDLERITGRSSMTLRRWWEKDKFPKPIKLHSSVLAWNALTIQHWINENIPETNND